MEERIQKMTPKGIEDSIKENVDLKIEASYLKEEIERLQGKCKDKEELVQRLSHQHAETRNAAIARYSEYEGKVEGLVARLASFEAELIEGKQLVTTLQNKLTLSKQREESIIETLNQERHLSTEKQKEFERLYVEVNDHLENLQDELQTALKDKDSLSKELESQRITHKQLEFTIEQLENEKESLLNSTVKKNTEKEEHINQLHEDLRNRTKVFFRVLNQILSIIY